MNRYIQKKQHNIHISTTLLPLGHTILYVKTKCTNYLKPGKIISNKK